MRSPLGRWRWRPAAAGRPLSSLAGSAALASGLALALSLAWGGCAPKAPPNACADLRFDGAERRNLVVLLGDTLRRDRVGIYGGSAATPAFDDFAREHLWFANAFSQSPWTKPSVATLFTSLYPSQHRLAADPRFRLPEPGEEGSVVESDRLVERFDTLPETLRAGGYRTAAVIANPWLEKGFGFDQGFETFDDELAAWDAPGVRVVERGLAWLDARPPDDSPFFLYLHAIDPHRPYPELTERELFEHADRLGRPEPGLAPAAQRSISQLVRLERGRTLRAAGLPASRAAVSLAYDKGVEAFDLALGRLLEGLAERGFVDDTAVVILSDHGEALFTRGYGNHGRGLFDDEVAIPMAARLPGVAADGARVDCPVGLVDVLPTLCTYLGLACPEAARGRSLLAPGPALETRPVVIEGVGGHPAHRAIVHDGFKLLYEPDGAPTGRPSSQPYALFDRRRDPEEERDLLAAGEDGARAAMERLGPVLHDAVESYAAPDPEAIPLDRDLHERLEALGYVDAPEGREPDAAPR